jgi:hypothetical protein
MGIFSATPEIMRMGSDFGEPTAIPEKKTNFFHAG